MTTPDTARCQCGHFVVVHQLIVSSKAKRRGPCSHMDGKGQCPCRGPR